MRKNAHKIQWYIPSRSNEKTSIPEQKLSLSVSNRVYRDINEVFTIAIHTPINRILLDDLIAGACRVNPPNVSEDSFKVNIRAYGGETSGGLYKPFQIKGRCIRYPKEVLIDYCYATQSLYYIWRRLTDG